MIEVFLVLQRQMENWKPDRMRVFLKAIFKKFRPEQRAAALDSISQELATTEDDDVVRSLMGSLDPDLWPEIEESARIRIEYKLIGSMRAGQWDDQRSRCNGGALGTFGTRFLERFQLRSHAEYLVQEKLASPSRFERLYAQKFMLHELLPLRGPFPWGIVRSLKNQLGAGDKDLYAALEVRAMIWDEDGWPPELKTSYAEFKAAEEISSDDDVPF